MASDGGIYVVSNKAIYRFQWNASAGWDTALKSPIDSPASCNLCWRQTYPSGTNAKGTYSNGSGSTPSLMGPGGEYVVITDGSTVANLSVYRTGSLGNGQQRLAAKMPVDFGQPNRAQTSTEQSVVVSDYGMAVVSNDYRNLRSLGADLPLVLRPVVNSLLSLPVMKNVSNAKVTLTGYGPNH